MFNYGSFKLLLLKIFLGILFFSFSSFLFVSIFSYSPNDPGIGRLVGKSEIANFFGFWGAISSSVLIILFGKASYLLVVFLMYLSVFLVLGLNLKRPFLKFFLILLSIMLFNISLLLQQNFKVETGLFSKILIDDFLYRYLIVVFFALISIFLSIYCFSFIIIFFKNLFLKFLSFNFF